MYKNIILLICVGMIFSLDKDCLDFLETNFNNNIYNLFNKIDKGMYKADLWRICKLFKTKFA